MTKPLYRLRADGTIVGPIHAKNYGGLRCRLVDHPRGFRQLYLVECLTCGARFDEGDYLPCVRRDAGLD